jgi:hypothetical protein
MKDGNRFGFWKESSRKSPGTMSPPISAQPGKQAPCSATGTGTDTGSKGGTWPREHSDPEQGFAGTNGLIGTVSFLEAGVRRE